MSDERRWLEHLERTSQVKLIAEDPAVTAEIEQRRLLIESQLQAERALKYRVGTGYPNPEANAADNFSW